MMLFLLKSLILVTIFDEIKSSWYLSDVSLPENLTFTQILADNVSNKILTFGSFQNDDVWIWKHATSNKWQLTNITTPKNPFFSPINAHSKVVNNLVYFIGMITYINKQYPYWNVSDRVFVFDIIKHKWITNEMNITKIPHPQRNGCVANNDTHVFVVGGVHSQTEPINFLQIFNIQENKWNMTSLPPEFACNDCGWWNQYCSMADNILYVFGGNTNATLHGLWPDSDAMYKYDTVKCLWFHIGYKTYSSSQGYAAYYAKTKWIYIIGGSTLTSNGTYIALNAVEIFDLQSESIISVNHLVEAVCSSASLIVDDEIMVFGGNYFCNSASPSSSIQILDLTESDEKGKEMTIWITIGVVGYIVCILVSSYLIFRKRRPFDGSMSALTVNSDGVPHRIM